MKTLEKVSDFVGKYMAAIVIVVAAGALFFPGPFSVVKTSWVNTLLGIVMFGMGLTLKPNDFKVVFSRPKAPAEGGRDRRMQNSVLSGSDGDAHAAF